MKKTLAGVTINRLEIIEPQLCEGFWLVWLVIHAIHHARFCRNHNVCELFIDTSDIGPHFCQFQPMNWNTIFPVSDGVAIDLAEINTAVDVYERSSIDSQYFFLKSIQTWNNYSAHLCADEIAMQIVTAFEAPFRQHNYPFGVKSHIRSEQCNRTDAGEIVKVQHLRSKGPVRKPRGFYFTWTFFYFFRFYAFIFLDWQCLCFLLPHKY